MFCTNCGKQLDDNLVFCIYCGSKILRGSSDAEVAEAEPDGQVGELSAEIRADVPEAELAESEQQDASIEGAIAAQDPAAVTPTQVMSSIAQAPNPVETERAREAENVDLPPTAAIAMLALALVALVAALFLPRILDGRARVPAHQAQQEQAAQQGDTQDGTQEEPGEGGSSAAGVVRADLAAYTWEELSVIAQEISAQPSRPDALKVAQGYNLVNADGTMSSNTKDVVLKDGTRITVRIADVYHDDMSDRSGGSGKAGITFMATNFAGNRKYHSGHTVTGGWASSDMRAYLNEDFVNLLPDDLWQAITPVRKLSNNTGITTSTSSVTTTTDIIWLPSVVEICGPLTWDYSSNPRNKNAYNAIFSAEGSQYALFSECGVTDEEKSNGVLSLGGTWWMRSVAPSTSRGRWVDEKGNPACFGNADDSRGVVIAFCL